SEPIQVQADASRVIVSGTVSDTEVIENVLKMAGIYSNNVVNSLTLGVPAHERQILLEVKFAEVDRTRLDQLGFNILSTGTLNTPGAISTQQFGPPSVGQTGIQSQIGASLAGTETNFSVTDILNVFLFRPDINLATTIRALEQNSVLQILAEPNLMALSGRPARFLAGGEFPFPVVQGGTNFTAVTIQFRPFGVRLEFTGYITKDDVIRMQVSPEVSTLDFTNALTISGFLVPAVSTRKAETEIELRDGQTFGIAGLMDQRTQATMSKIPGIGDLPIIGRLFRSKSANRSRTELLVLVTPRIVDPVREEFEAPAAPRPALRDLVVPEFDSGIPKGERSKPPAEESAPQK
ncbi:MAG: type II and III secretion system protein, partial [Acidobacteria bacterium]|nr:type II and III secretion system protein [Acidobacteriota bacterium]